LLDLPAHFPHVVRRILPGIKRVPALVRKSLHFAHLRDEILLNHAWETIQRCKGRGRRGTGFRFGGAGHFDTRVAKRESRNRQAAQFQQSATRERMVRQGVGHVFR